MDAGKIIVANTQTIGSLSKLFEKPRSQFEFLLQGGFEIVRKDKSESKKVATSSMSTVTTSVATSEIIFSRPDIGVTFTVTSEKGFALCLEDSGSIDLVQKSSLKTRLHLDSKFLSHHASPMIVDAAFKITQDMEVHPETYTNFSAIAEVCRLLLFAIEDKNTSYNKRRIETAKKNCNLQLEPYDASKIDGMRYLLERL